MIRTEALSEVSFGVECEQSRLCLLFVCLVWSGLFTYPKLQISFSSEASIRLKPLAERVVFDIAGDGSLISGRLGSHLQQDWGSIWRSEGLC